MSKRQVVHFRPVLEVLEDRLALSRFLSAPASEAPPLRFGPVASQPAFRFPQVGIPGTGEEATGLLGAGIPGTGIEGTGLTGAGIPGTGIQNTGLTGAGLPGTGIQNTGLTGAGLPGTGIQNTGLTGAGIPGTGVAGTGLIGWGPATAGGPNGLTSPTVSPLTFPFGIAPFGFTIPPSTGTGVSVPTPGTGMSGGGIPGTGIAGTGLSGAGIPGTGMANTGLSGPSGPGSGAQGGTSAGTGQRAAGTGLEGFYAALAASGLPM